MKEENNQIVPTILIVDDNPKNIQIVALLLRDMKYKIIIATDGKSAIDLVKRARPDLILMDVMMPGLDGFETCRIIKDDPENDNIPVIFLTALSEKINTVKGFQSGGVDYVVKPFNREELINRIKTHLDLKFTRDELNQSSEHLRELNAIKDKMFSIIGHDLRSPVAVLKTMLDFISKDPVILAQEDLKNDFGAMTQTADELYSLLENLLGWAKSQSGNLGFISENIELKLMVQSVYLLYKSQLQHKKIQFEEDINPAIYIFADANMLKTVLRNLISNGIKFTPENGTIKVRAHENNGKVQIEVADSGVGISSENIPKLFDMKQHFSTYGTANESGSGLGLNLCYNFVVNNNGKIWVKSEPGNGSVFTVELAAGTPPPDQSPDKSNSTKAFH